MWKYFAALVALLAMGGLSVAQDVAPGECADCYNNIITQEDWQSISNVYLGYDTEVATDESDVDVVAVGNEGLSTAIIVTPDKDNDELTSSATAPFARIDQYMDQSIDGLGTADPSAGQGAKGVTWNKAIQAAWIANQGDKEPELDGTILKEGSYIGQSTTQDISAIVDYDSREEAKVLNLDNKLAMIVDNITTIIDIAAKAVSESSDSASSNGTITNVVNGTISFVDP